MRRRGEVSQGPKASEDVVGRESSGKKKRKDRSQVCLKLLPAAFTAFLKRKSCSVCKREASLLRPRFRTGKGSSFNQPTLEI